MIPEADATSSSSVNLLPGIEALMVLLGARGRETFAQASPLWLEHGAEPFFQEVAELGENICHLAEQEQEVGGAILLTGLPRPGEGEGSQEGEQMVALHGKPDTLKVSPGS
jgi:hypothetical protein